MKYTSILLTAFAALAIAQNDDKTKEPYAENLEDFIEDCFEESTTFDKFAECYLKEEGETAESEPIAHDIEDALETCLRDPAEGSDKATLESFGKCYTKVALNRDYSDEQVDKETYAIGLEKFIVDCLDSSEDSYDQLKTCYNDFTEDDAKSPEPKDE